MSSKILVIDDSGTIREMLKHLLQALGYDLITARNGIEGPEVAGRERPAAILCDIVMADVDGFEVLERLKRHQLTQAIRVLLLTAFSDRKNRERIQAAGFAGHVAKRCEFRQLPLAIETILMRR
jgi:two-component system, sensor histidine kinase and response regulator